MDWMKTNFFFAVTQVQEQFFRSQSFFYIFPTITWSLVSFLYQNWIVFLLISKWFDNYYLLVLLSIILDMMRSTWFFFNLDRMIFLFYLRNAGNISDRFLIFFFSFFMIEYSAWFVLLLVMAFGLLWWI